MNSSWGQQGSDHHPTPLSEQHLALVWMGSGPELSPGRWHINYPHSEPNSFLVKQAMIQGCSGNARGSRGGVGGFENTCCNEDARAVLPLRFPPYRQGLPPCQGSQLPASGRLPVWIGHRAKGNWPQSCSCWHLGPKRGYSPGLPVDCEPTWVSATSPSQSPRKAGLCRGSVGSIWCHSQSQSQLRTLFLTQGFWSRA